MSHTPPKDDELAGTEQPFVQHLVELRDRLLYAIYGVAAAVAVLAMWPGPNGLIDFIARPIRAHMPPDAKLIAVGVFSPFVGCRAGGTAVAHLPVVGFCGTGAVQP